MKIVEYNLSHYQDVDGYLKRGYQPWGSPFVKQDRLTGGGYRDEVYQAMVKYEDLLLASPAKPGEWSRPTSKPEDGSRPLPAPKRPEPNPPRTMPGGF